MRETPYDIAVIGAGPAGSVAARVLARAGKRVLLIDGRRPDDFRVGESLVPSARTMLRDLDLLEQFMAGGHLPCRGNRSAWGSSTIDETDFIRSPYGHGWHLDRIAFDAMLARAAGDAGASLMPETQLVRFDRLEGAWRLHLRASAENITAECSWLIDAAGRGSRIASAIGVERRHEDRLVAFHARFRGAGEVTDRDSRTLIESVAEGWFHTALLPGGERVVTLFTDADAPWLNRIKEAAGFLEAINRTEHLSRMLNDYGYRITGRLRSADARSSRLDRFYGDGWMAVGDAAVAFDPLSSQGILFAIYSGLKAGEALVNYSGDDGDDALNGYASAVGGVYDSFLEHRLSYYHMEQRWPGSPFWMARQPIRAADC
ncbi:MAG: oxidoreductase [Chlorobi bacterium]|nr:oxidoreductase [Chlorobiota bacterium]